MTTNAVVRHRRSAPGSLATLRFAAVAAAVYAVWGFLAGPLLVDAIGLWPTRAVAGLLIAALLWRH
jgi:hypothetical protein